MDKFIPKEKLSKKAKRERAKAQRKTWDLNPVTRKPKNPKAYVREKPRIESDDDDTGAFFILPLYIPFSGHCEEHSTPILGTYVAIQR